MLERPTTSSPPVATVRNVEVRYGATLALDGVDLTIAPGLVHGLIGMNGSGKSTLFKTLMGLVRPDVGTVELFGGSSTAARKAGRVAYAPQTEDIDQSFPVSVREIVAMGRYNRLGPQRRLRAEDHAAVDAALERTELTALADRQIGALSGGQRKRAFIARGLAQGAELLLLDEPFAGVDKRTEATITELLRDLAAEGRTILVSTHDLIAVPALCDEIALINRRIIATGTVEETLRPDLLADAFGGFVPASALQDPSRNDRPSVAAADTSQDHDPNPQSDNQSDSRASDRALLGHQPRQTTTDSETGPQGVAA